ncbi:MAG: hypothetical protein ACI4SP_01415 [Eubacteriales bacterium]
MFFAILKLVGGIIIAAGLGGYLWKSELLILAIAAYIGGAALAIQGAFSLIKQLFGRVAGSSSSNYTSSNSSSGSSSSGGKRFTRPTPPDDSDDDDSDNGLKAPDDHVGYLISTEISRRLPAVTPATGIYCTVYSDGSAYLSGGITLWHASDADRVTDAVKDGFNAALRKAAKEGYDVGRISGLDPSGVTLEAAGE